ncbi:MAG: bifunctional metallophosphatase/5'-nucleotidase [Gemmatimonadota bacterium]
MGGLGRGAARGAWIAALATGCGGTKPASVGEDGGPDVVRVTLLGTTDVHGHLLPYEYPTDRPARESLAQVGTLVDSVRAADGRVLLFDSGDLLQGSALDEYEARAGRDSVHPVIAAMNELGYAAAAIGNHEYNYGLPFLHSALEDARFPFLSANTLRAGTDSVAFDPYVLLDLDGVRVGVVGFTTPGVAIWDRDNVRGRLEFMDIVEAARRWVPRLEAERPDLVVAVVHSGVAPGSSYTAEGVPEENAVARLAGVNGIDVIFAGHTHVRIDGRLIGRTLVVQAGRHANALAVVHIDLERHAGRWRVRSREGFTIGTADVPARPWRDPRIRDAHERTLAWLREPIGFTPDRWSAAEGRVRDTPIADLVTAVERGVSGADLASTAVFSPSAAFGPGPISRRDILGLYVYPNTLRAVRISGADLAAYLEWSARYFNGYPADPIVNDSVPGYNFDLVSGVEYTLDLRRPVGRRVTRLSREGVAVSPADTFTLAVNNYRQSGGGGAAMIGRAPLVYGDEIPISQRIIDFVRARDTLRIADVYRENWRLEPAAARRQLLSDEATRSRH